MCWGFRVKAVKAQRGHKIHMKPISAMSEGICPDLSPYQATYFVIPLEPGHSYLLPCSVRFKVQGVGFAKG